MRLRAANVKWSNEIQSSVDLLDGREIDLEIIEIKGMQIRNSFLPPVELELCEVKEN